MNRSTWCLSDYESPIGDARSGLLRGSSLILSFDWRRPIFFLCLRTPTRPINPVEIKNNIGLLMLKFSDMVLLIRLSFFRSFWTSPCIKVWSEWVEIDHPVIDNPAIKTPKIKISLYLFRLISIPVYFFGVKVLGRDSDYPLRNNCTRQQSHPKKKQV